MSGKKTTITAMMIAIGTGTPIALSSAAGAPEWIMLMPAGVGGVIDTRDGRGPYRVGDAAALATRSLQAAEGRLPIDENHSTDLAAPNGAPSPARGWAVELQARADGIWGRIEWSDTGRSLMGERAYRFISPVFSHDKAGNVTGLLRASLTNTPNLRGMAALNAQRTDMDLLAQLRTLLGLADDADEAAVIAKIKSLTGDDNVATAAALAPIAKAAGLKVDAAGAAIVTAVATLKSSTAALASIAKAAGLKDDADAASIERAVTTLAAGQGDAIRSLQSELTETTTKLNTLVETTSREKAEAFIDGAIADGRVGLKPMRDHYIARHMKDAKSVEQEVAAMSVLKPGAHLPTTPPKNIKAEDQVDLSDSVALASAANKYRDEQAKLGVNVSIADAVTIIKERQQ